MDAATWSAIAAGASACAAMGVVWVQHRNLIEAARPVLILDGWKRSKAVKGSSSTDVISFEKIQNIGKGPALHVTIYGISKDSSNAPTYVLSNCNKHTIPADREVDVADGDVHLYWGNVTVGVGDHKMMGVVINIYSWSLTGYRYKTVYRLMIEESDVSFIGGAECIAPGVYVSSWNTTCQSVRRLQFFQKLSKNQWVGKVIPSRWHTPD